MGQRRSADGDVHCMGCASWLAAPIASATYGKRAESTLVTSCLRSVHPFGAGSGAFAAGARGVAGGCQSSAKVAPGSSCVAVGRVDGGVSYGKVSLRLAVSR